METAFRRQVSVHDNEAAIHDIVADGLEEKRLAASILSYYETEGSTTLAYYVDIVEQSLYLLAPSHGDERQAYARHHATFERVDDTLGYAPRYLDIRFTHYYILFFLFLHDSPQ